MISTTENFTLGTLAICIECSGEFNPRPRQRLCSKKCKMRFYNREKDRKLRERKQLLQHFDLPPSGPISDQDKEAVSLYRDKKLGFKTIARFQGRSDVTVRNGLIKAGVYRPKFNGTANKGFGKNSRVPCAEELKLRKQKAKASKKVLRDSVAKCIRNFKRGVPIETTCNQNGWKTPSVWNLLYKSKAYAALRDRLGSDDVSEQYKAYKKFKWTSSLYESEDEFQNKVEAIIGASSLKCERELQCTGSRSRVDFLLSSGEFVEVKTCTKPNVFDRLLGQVARYTLLDKRKAIVLIPDDIQVRKDQVSTIAALGAEILNESQFCLRLGVQGNEVVAVTSKTTVATGLCRCCGVVDSILSQGRSGARSYCISCEPIIPLKYYHSMKDRWLYRGTI